MYLKKNAIHDYYAELKKKKEKREREYVRSQFTRCDLLHTLYVLGAQTRLVYFVHFEKNMFEI